MRKKFVIIMLIINAVFLIGFGIDAVVYSSLANKLPSQLEGERFEGEYKESRFAQVSAYFPDDGGLTWYQIRQLRETLTDELELQAIEPVFPDAPLFLDSFSGQAGTVQIKTLNSSAVADVIVTGGDYFTFHPLRLQNGSYIYEDELMRDRIVIDELAAWNLFGSFNAEGMKVLINDNVYVVAGVIQIEQDEDSQKAFKSQFEGDNALVIMPYEAFDETGEEFQFTTYEFVTQELFTGYIENNLFDSQSVLSDALVKTNTGRFSLGNIFDQITDSSERTLRTSPIVFPYWENAAILVENRLMVLAILGTVCAAIPILTVIFIFGWLLKHSKGKWKVITNFVGDVLDKWRSWRWRRKAKGEIIEMPIEMIDAPEQLDSQDVKPDNDE